MIISGLAVIIDFVNKRFLCFSAKLIINKNRGDKTERIEYRNIKQLEFYGLLSALHIWSLSFLKNNHLE